MRCKWMVGLGITLGLYVGSGFAGEIQWRPAGQPAPIASSVENAAPCSPTAWLGDPVPAASLGTPRPLSELTAQATGEQQPADPHLAAVSYSSSPSADDSPAIVRAQAPDLPPPPGSAVPPFPGTGEVPAPSGSTWLGNGYQRFVGGVTGIFQTNGERHPFQSDHCEDGFISPVSSPFLFEDPRALTELRPVFIFQAMPSKSIGHGGDIEFLGLQGRVALTDRIDIVMSKLGWIWDEPHNAAIPSASSLSEFDFGPKYTFYRSEETLAAAGLTFQIPAGSKKAFQDTGTLSMVPYASVAQNFGKSQYGSFNAMGTMAYAASIDSERSDYLFTGLHLDYDIASAHKFYPLIELNWTHYTTSGNNPLTSGFEGGDLFNLGSQNVAGHNNLTLALGGRYKFSESMQLGSTIEFPLVGTKDLLDFRWTVDMIFRY